MTDSRKLNAKPPKFSDLKLENIAVELRYSYAYLFWDLAGHVWRDVRYRLPPNSFVVNNANPGSVWVNYAGKYQLVIEAQRMAVGCMHPEPDLKEFFEITEVLYSLTIERLEIDTFDRIGLRQIFVKSYDSFAEVKKVLLSLPSISVPSGLLSKSTSEEVGVGLTFRIESDSTGTFYNLHGVDRSIDIGVPPEFSDSVENNKETVYHQSVLTLDTDVYTKTAISAGQVKIAEWMRQGIMYVKEKGPNFF